MKQSLGELEVEVGGSCALCVGVGGCGKGKLTSPTLAGTLIFTPH